MSGEVKTDRHLDCTMQLNQSVLAPRMVLGTNGKCMSSFHVTGWKGSKFKKQQ